MTNPYVTYYVNQVGSGISHFQGVKYQKGHGFFGRLWKSALLPFLKQAGRQGVQTTLGLAEDALAGKNMKESAKTRFGQTGRDLGSAAIKQAQTFMDQEGSGIKRKRSRSVKRSPTKKRKSVASVSPKKKVVKRSAAAKGTRKPTNKIKRQTTAAKRKATKRKTKTATGNLFSF